MALEVVDPLVFATTELEVVDPTEQEAPAHAGAVAPVTCTATPVCVEISDARLCRASGCAASCDMLFAIVLSFAVGEPAGIVMP